MFLFEFRAEVNREEIYRVMGLSSSEDRIVVAGVFDMIPDCDRATDHGALAAIILVSVDRRTDRRNLSWLIQ